MPNKVFFYLYMAEDTIMTGGQLPINLPEYEETKPNLVEEEQEKIPEFEIPEYDVADFEEDSRFSDGNQLEAPVMSQAELDERRQLLRKLSRYQTMFKAEVQGLPLSDASTMTLHNLRNLTEDAEFMVATRKCAQASRSLFLSPCTIAEAVSKPIGIKLNGLTNVCAGNEELLSTIDELSIKYESTVMISVEQRFLMQMGQLCIAIHSHNKSLDAREAANLNSDKSEISPITSETNQKILRKRRKLGTSSWKSYN